MSRHVIILNLTRILIAILFCVTIWYDHEIIGKITATVGTLMWLFMHRVVRYEEKLIDTCYACHESIIAIIRRCV